MRRSSRIPKARKIYQDPTEDKEDNDKAGTNSNSRKRSPPSDTITIGNASKSSRPSSPPPALSKAKKERKKSGGAGTTAKTTSKAPQHALWKDLPKQPERKIELKLEELTSKFLTHMREFGEMDLNYATELLDMEKKHKRRIYDVVGVMEGCGVMDRNKTMVTWGERSRKRSKNLKPTILQSDIEELKKEEETLNECLQVVTESMASHLQTNPLVTGDDIMTAIENTGNIGSRSFAVSYPNIMAPAHDFRNRTGKIGLSNRQHYIGKKAPNTSLVLKCQKRKNQGLQITGMFGLWDDADDAKTYLDDLPVTDHQSCSTHHFSDFY